jgi:hypothetical protein
MNNIKSESAGRSTFHLEERYPDAKNIFSMALPSVAEIKDHALIVIDTNVLLLPYGVQPKSLKDIEETYLTLILANRLFIPSQVAREFAKNRGKELENLYSRIHRKQNITVLSDNFMLLGDEPTYLDVLRLETEIEAKIVEYRKAVKSVLNLIRSWKWDDPVTALYRKVGAASRVVELTSGTRFFSLELSGKGR